MKAHLGISAVPSGPCLFLQTYPALRTGLLSAVPAEPGLFIFDLSLD
jgi:hypothetical protein